MKKLYRLYKDENECTQYIPIFFHINNLSLPHTKKENNNKAEVKN